MTDAGPVIPGAGLEAQPAPCYRPLTGRLAGRFCDGLRQSGLDDTPRLEVTEISRRFSGKTVVDRVSMQLDPGQVTCLLGPSGCGKSTTLRIIAGVDRPDSGSVRIDGRTVCDDRHDVPPEDRQVGLIFQDFALFPHLSAAANVGFGLRGNAAARAERVDALLAEVDLTGYGRKYPHELSGGEQQRVALARALAPGPGVMLMDEPFSGLDERLRDEVRDRTLDILKNAGTAVLLVTHDPQEAMRMADQIALMRDGRIVQTGAPFQIYTQPADLAAAAFFSDLNVVEGRFRAGVADTVFGPFPAAAGPTDGDPVQVAIRPQHIAIDFDRSGRGPAPTEDAGTPARAMVERARFMGSESLIEFRLDAGGAPLTASVPGVFLPEKGRAFWLSVRRDRAFVFPGQSD
ncbi:MAG: ABC transporter ATP-binding protein [Pseudomonadota bacterium]